MNIVQLVRWLSPHGIVEWRHRKFRLRRLGLPNRKTLDDAASFCNFDLWPVDLKDQNTPWTLLDVGANEGQFTAAATSLAHISEVHAFEPQRSCHPALTVTLDHAKKGVLHPVAVGDRPDRKEFFCTTNSRMASLLQPRKDIAASYTGNNFEIVDRTQVDVVRIDDELPADISIGLMKLDVQGYEIPALRGATRVLRQTRAVLMEVNYVQHYEGAPLFDEVLNFMHAQGFRIHGISAPFVAQSGPLWADAVFVRSRP